MVVMICPPAGPGSKTIAAISMVSPKFMIGPSYRTAGQAPWLTPATTDCNKLQIFALYFICQTAAMPNNRLTRLSLLFLPFLLSIHRPVARITVPGPALESSIVAIRPATDSTYAERLGYPRGAVVLLIHVDDAGMSLESNEGAIAALTRGAATSVSVMMPCPWVPEFVGWLRNHPAIDAG